MRSISLSLLRNSRTTDSPAVAKSGEFLRGLAARLSLCALLIVCVAAAQTAPAPSKAKAAPTKPYAPPKTPWGDPDLQGLWPGSINIPLQRPASFGTRNELTDQELAERDKQEKQRVEGGHWIEYYPSNRQASLIVDPPNGRLPPMTAEAAKRNGEMRDGLGPPSLAGVERRANSWLDFDLWGRCITKGLIGSMLPGNLYNKGNQILQAPGYFVIRNEMVHETRVIPLDGRPHVGQDVRSYMGDGRGHWEGNTLVVETTNFVNDIGMNGINQALLTDKLRIIERFTRTAPDQLSYDATVEDPGTWTRPWTMHVPYMSDPTYTLYEYACHEANYGLSDILKGARATEAAAAKK
ncbi:MAG: hypothetical protein JO307_02455 [Bryobacterales bacterium]|nr:hypothetical protein [Bryobacterales bacterium]